jgi:hypothetical protein
VEPEDGERLRGIELEVKAIDPSDIVNLFNFARKESEEEEQEQVHPVLGFFKDRERNKIEIAPYTDVNDNLVELKRMELRKERVPTELKEIEASGCFREMQKASNKEIADTMAKLFHFLSAPSETISRETFALFLRLVTKEDSSLEETNKFYDKFVQKTLMDEPKFKAFIMDYVQYNY